MEEFNQEEPIPGFRSGRQRQEVDSFNHEPTFKDEMALNVEGLLSVDPAKGLHDRARKFVASRPWTTPSIEYQDCRQEEFAEETPLWSMVFSLGLDHALKVESDWFADVEALVEFVRDIAMETGCVFSLEFGRRSERWRSMTIAFVDDDPDSKPDLEEIRYELVPLIWHQTSGWRKLFGI